MSKQYIGAIDLGTTSNRFIIFNKKGEIVSCDQKEHEQIFPKPGWVEHDPVEIWQNTSEVIKNTLEKSGLKGSDLAAIGITNQRETTIVWDKKSGKPYYNAIVWQCTRTDKICRDITKSEGQNRFREKTGLPVATYFSGPKLKWILENVPEAQKAAEKGDAAFGTVESWIIWHLTGGAGRGVHVTDVTNASRTMLMNIDTLKWDDEILRALSIPESMLPEIVPSIDKEIWGNTEISGPLGAEVPVCGALGDQQAALFGQACFSMGDAKNTYGTGCFLLLNTGTTPVHSRHGLITTLGYHIRGEKPIYCLEGSIAMAGALVQWFRDNLGIIQQAADIEKLAKSVDDNGGAYIVPAFSGLFAPYWRSDARGLIAGLTRFVNKGHLARAVLEASAFQTNDIVDAMNKDSGMEFGSLKVDGGMVANELLMQFLADILGFSVIRPEVTETTALGAAYAAGLAVGFWSDIKEVSKNWKENKRWSPVMDTENRAGHLKNWKKAVDRTMGWEE